MHENAEERKKTNKQTNKNVSLIARMTYKIGPHLFEQDSIYIIFFCIVDFEQPTSPFFHGSSSSLVEVMEVLVLNDLPREIKVGGVKETKKEDHQQNLEVVKWKMERGMKVV
jgi:hypothetical protein